MRVNVIVVLYHLSVAFALTKDELVGKQRTIGEAHIPLRSDVPGVFGISNRAALGSPDKIHSCEWRPGVIDLHVICLDVLPVCGITRTRSYLFGWLRENGIKCSAVVAKVMITIIQLLNPHPSMEVAQGSVKGTI